MPSHKFSATHSYLEGDSSLPIATIQPNDDDLQNPPNRTSTRNMNNQDVGEPRVPTHPIPAFQAAFAESMLEASRAPSRPQNGSKDASERRKVLLDQERYEDTHASRWKQKPGQRFHELWKLMSQISFGVYLLLNGIAKDDEQVLNILQGHVDEVDQFLETTLEDFDLGQQDIDDRLKLLKVPLQNIKVFDTMLEDRAFRLQIVNGNERIEHIITRTDAAMNDALKNVEQGISATRQFIIYLTEEDEDNGWKEEQPEMIRVFDAMKGNANGWYRAFNLLQTKGRNLDASLVQLGSIVHEMSRRAGEISRSKRFSTDHTSPTASSSSVSPTSPQRDIYRHNQSTSQNYSIDDNIIVPKAVETLSPSSTSSSSQQRDPYQHSQSANHKYSIDENIISPVSITQETLPARQYSERMEPVSESRPQKENQQPKLEPQIYTLKPTTYTPTPSPSRTPMPKEETQEPEETPQISKRSSLRNRFSLKRKSPLEVVEHKEPVMRSATLLTPPTSGQGTDSAYFSDSEKIYISGGVTTPSYEKIAFPEKVTFPPSPQIPYGNLTHRPSLPRLDSDSSYKSIGSPNNDSRLNLRPVNANPNSPLQRPWTAAPDDRRAPPSRMGMSTMSEMTSASTMTDSTQKPPKKKRNSPFHWFKKAFSLSEEEKAAFEAKRRAPDPRPEERVKPMFLDGRRLKEGSQVVYTREGATTRASARTRDGATTSHSTRTVNPLTYREGATTRSSTRQR